MCEPRLLFLHALAPPTPGGTPVIVRRLLSRLAPVELETVTDVLLLKRVRRGEPRLPGRYHYVVKVPPLADRWLAGRVLTGLANYVLALLAGARAAAVARRSGAGWVLSVADHGFSVIAADACARLAGVPHLIWVFDLWEENAYNDVDRWCARRLERRLWRRAAAVLGHADEMSRHYEHKHGVRCHILPTPIELDHQPPDRPALDTARPREVLFAGALYWAQEETLRRLAQVCQALDDVRLTIVGDEVHARALAIEADCFEQRLSPSAFRARVEQADVAFVGLSFNSPHPEVIATATPARLSEYMASGTPILIHAPPGSYVAEYARRGEFAEVVDAPDPDALAAGLRRVLDDQGLSTMRVRRAQELAARRHDVAVVAEELRSVLEQTRRQ